MRLSIALPPAALLAILALAMPAASMAQTAPPGGGSGGSSGEPSAGEPGARDLGAAAEAAFVERLYHAGEDYRAESEALRFVHAHPRHPLRPAVELARAKLYHRAGRPEEATLMLYSLLDRAPPPEVALDAQRLLTFAHLRRGDPVRAAETAAALDAAGESGSPRASLQALRDPPPGTVDTDAAVAWSTWLPGSGYFLLDEPGKAVTGLTLNVALLGAAALAAQNDNGPAALLFLVLEAMLWQGGRSGVRQDAEAHNRQLREARLEAWLVTHGERELLAVGIRMAWGGAP